MRNVDLVEVARAFIELKKVSGNDFAACCPFHNEKTPSFHINAAKQVYHCFGCGVGGNIITFVKGMMNTDYIGAVRWLAEHYHFELPESDDGYGGDRSAAARHRKEHDDGMRLLDDAAGWFESQLNTPEGAEARQYLAERGIDEATIKQWRIGYAPQSGQHLMTWAHERGVKESLLNAVGLTSIKEEERNKTYVRFRQRIVFPICDELSRVVGFSARVFGPNPPSGGKYVNSPESEYFHKGRLFYGLNFARTQFRHTGWALICEGQLDVIACHRAGMVQAVAALGTAFTEEHSRILRRSGVPCVHLAYDGDDAGMKAAVRTIGILQQDGMQVMITPLPAGEDPDSVFRTGGASALQQMMSVVEPSIPFVYKKALAQYPENTPEARSQVVTAVLDTIVTLTDPIAAAGHCQALAKQVGLSEELITGQLALRRNALAEEKRRSERYEQMRNSRTPLQAAVERHFGVPVALIEQRGIINSVLEILLDLALHSHAVAVRLAEQSELLQELPDSPATQTLLHILASVHDDEWHETVRMLPQTSAVDDSLVSKVVTMPQFAEIADDAAVPQDYEIALNDCMNVLQRKRLTRQEQEIAAQMQQQQGSGDFSDLNRLRELALQKKELRGRRML